MSQEEMHDFCTSIQPYQLSVQVRLKNGTEIFIGKVINVKTDRFDLAVPDKEPIQVRFAWVSKIAHAG